MPTQPHDLIEGMKKELQEFELILPDGTFKDCLVYHRAVKNWLKSKLHEVYSLGRVAGVREATEIRFIKGRLKFDDQENSAPFQSAIVIFKSLTPNKP